LYRVNRSGEFNVPWGKYKRPYKIDMMRFETAREILRRARIELGDFSEVLDSETEEGDLVFLDPPYVPVSNYSDFKRYTRQQFHSSDHVRMAELVRVLAQRGCHVIVTNSNHPLVHDLYRDYDIEVVQTKRSVNSQGHGRSGEDVIINVKRT
jgi:DNA adenine methylase